MNIEYLLNESFILEGNINRMLITNNMDELITLYSTALDRLNKIYCERCKTLLEEKIKNRK